MMKNTNSAIIVKMINRFDQELKKQIEADLKVVKKIQHNIIGKINPEANITRLSIA